MINIFSTNSRISWRKILTALCAVLFAFSYIGNQAFKFAEIPGTYIGIIGLVFAFYFAKDAIPTKKEPPAAN